ncbi:MAG: hypothetical protein MUO85_02290, partial [candidate division Zixibacteria bacterium]|nr:hypothetical protein [candidate division Zixibacteria bacterium]
AFEDEKASNCLMEDIHMHVAYKMSGAKSELPNDWIKALPPKIFDSLVNVGLLDGDDTASLRPLEKHIGDYMNALQARSLTHSHINTTINSITKIVDGCEYYSWYDITKEPDKIEQYLNELCVSKSASISNCYLKAIKQFANWMIANNRATKSPVVHLMPARKIRKYAENSKMDEAKEMPKVFCGQCKHLIEGRKCEHPQNKRTKHNWKHEYISLKEPPNHINKNNDCSWFEQC